MRHGYPFQSDIQLWSGFKAGSPEAYEQLYEKYFPILCNYGGKISRDKELIKDTLHDLFVDLWRSRERLGDTDSVKFYLYKAFRRKLVNQLKSRHKYVGEEMLPDHFDFVASPESTLIAGQISAEQQQQMLAALNALSKRQKEAVYLRYFENLTCAEVASVMALEVNSTYVLLSRAIDVLRKHLRKVFALLLVLIVE